MIIPNLARLGGHFLARTMTSKYALPSAQARKNSINSPWRKGPACKTDKAKKSWQQLQDGPCTKTGQ